MKTPTRDELVKILVDTHRSIIRDADEWRPLAQYILDLHGALTADLTAENEKLKVQLDEQDELVGSCLACVTEADDQEELHRENAHLREVNGALQVNLRAANAELERSFKSGWENEAKRLSAENARIVEAAYAVFQSDPGTIPAIAALRDAVHAHDEEKKP